MSDIKLDPYLYFKGHAREAMEFYRGVFGGELSMQSRAEVGMKDDHPEWLIHCRLEGGDAELMASDTEQASAEAKKIEQGISSAWSCCCAWHGVSWDPNMLGSRASHTVQARSSFISWGCCVVAPRATWDTVQRAARWSFCC
jgi:Glyoxalase/Bleomycin resistance protein/Dioxygenase superfamily